jgi:cell wall-associated NlpC family hydrolase
VTTTPVTTTPVTTTPVNTTPVGPTPTPPGAAPPPSVGLPAPLPRLLYTATAPTQPVTIKELDAAIVEYLDLGGAANEIETALRAAGLDPPPNTGTEVVARLLDLRLTHATPSQNGLDLLPNQDATRAEAAYSFGRLLDLGGESEVWVESLARAFSIPLLTTWQRRILTTAVHYVGYPYVWGGSSPTAEAPFGVEAPGGFDCSGFVWRVYKLTPYPDEGDLADVLVGRTTYIMSGEVPRAERIPAWKLEPGDVMFFGVGRDSKPSQVDHSAIYMGDGWLVQSSGEGVTIAPFDAYYRNEFAWARRPLHEAGLELALP